MSYARSYFKLPYNHPSGLRPGFTTLGARKHCLYYNHVDGSLEQYKRLSGFHAVSFSGQVWTSTRHSVPLSSLLPSALSSHWLSPVDGHPVVTWQQQLLHELHAPLCCASRWSNATTSTLSTCPPIQSSISTPSILR